MPINVLRISKYAIGSLMSLSIYTCYNNGCNIWASNHVTKIGFKERKIVEYENRIRQFSGPDKIFRYFATVSVESNNQQSKTLMTTDDFIRSISPGQRQPDDYGLDRFKTIPLEDYMKQFHTSKLLGKESVLNKIYQNSLISYNDYLLLLLILGTSKRIFKLTFKVFDENGDDKLSCQEFNQITKLIRQKSSMSNVNRSTFQKLTDKKSPLQNYLFGPNLDRTLTLNQFLNFQNDLQEDIMTYEFNNCNPKNCKIHETQFAKLVLTYASFSEIKKNEMILNIDKTYKDSSEGIDIENYKKFCKILQSINDMDIALTFYNLSGNSIDKATFKRVSKVVCHVDLDDYLVDVVFSIFDSDEDGKLSPDEFLKVMKKRLFRGINSQRDLGFIKALSSSINNMLSYFNN